MKRLAPIAALIFAACSGDGGQGLTDVGPQACSDMVPCPTGQLCVAGACETPECTSDDQCPDGTCFDNRCIDNPTCTDNEDCIDDMLCVAGTCIEAPACMDTPDCPGDLVCEQGMCVERDLTCEDDDACEEGEVCLFGECSPETACTDSSDCPAELRCIQDVCREPCTEDSECGAPIAWNCIESTGECQQRCITDGQCPEGQYCADIGPMGGLCEPAECTMDAECPGANMACVGADEGRGRCEEFTPCDANTPCPTGFACDEVNMRCEAIPSCRTDRDCDGDAYCANGFCQPADSCTNASCPGGFECVGAVCVPEICRSNADCTAPELCIGGACATPPNGNLVTSVRIITPPGYVRPGTSYQHEAVAYDQAERVVVGLSFNWTTSSTAVATIAGDGLATGGVLAGTTQIVASVNTPQGPVASTPVLLTNLGAEAPNQITLVVVRSETGAPLAGAEVRIDEGTFSTLLTTDAQGTVSSVANGPVNVTVRHPDRDWLSLVNLAPGDHRLPLPPRARADEAAGVRGTVDLSNVSTTGGLSFSLSGASLAPPLSSANLDALFGGEPFQVMVPMVGNIPVPAGQTFEAEFMGFQIPIKTDYYAESQGGLRAAWSFGGKVAIGAGGIGLMDLQNPISAILPFYQRFEHSLAPAVPLIAVPKIADANDIDGDGDTTELRPDWNALRPINHVPSVQQSLRYEVEVAPLPFVTGGNANTLIVVAGSLLPGIGFVPLGIDGASDAMGSGVVRRFVTKCAARYGGLETGQQVVLAIAVRVEMGAVAGPGSVRMFYGDTLPPFVNLASGWLDSPVGASLLANERRVDLGAGAPAAGVVRVNFSHPDGGWSVYGNVTPNGIVIPTQPMGMVDRTQGAEVTVDLLQTTSNDVTQLFGVSGSALSMDAQTEGFSRAVLQ